MRTAVKLSMVAALVAAALGLASCSQMVQPPPTPEELEQLVGTEWYSVLIFGQPSGYARIEAEVIEGPDGSHMRTSEDVKVLVNLLGQSREVSKSQITEYDQQFRPVSIKLVKNELGRPVRAEARLAHGELVVRTSTEGDSGAPARVDTFEVPDDLASDLILGVKLLRGKLDVGDTVEYSVYDPEINVIDRHIVTVDRRESVDDTEALVVKAASEELGIEVVSWIAGDGTMLRQRAPGLMDLTLERVTEEEALASLAPFELSNVIEVEHHLPLVRSVKEVRLRVIRNLGEAAELIPQTRRQTVTPDGQQASVTISRERPPEDSLPLPITEESMAEYLQPNKYLQCDDAGLVETAQEIVGDETDAWGAAQKLCSWVHREVEKVQSEPRPVTALEVLDEMRGDCTEHAILLAALGRAVGLPTRMVTGLAYVGGKFGYHAWTEVYVGRWVEMDPAWGEMTADAGHVLIYSSSLEQAEWARASLATGRTIGAIEMELLGYTKADGESVGFDEW
ncbi:MAG: transglutaminase-like domain-containing protein [Armatimonadota bacterium]|nr:transglutaminase-like domain-containing protein [Armatimonadota bacterium]